MNKKQYIGISRDHSASMRGLTRVAARDYNNQILAIQEAVKEHSIDTIISTVKCGSGYGAGVVRETVNSNVMILNPIREDQYIADGSATPLWDSVGELIELLESVPDANDQNVSFLVMVVTDGGENSSKKWSGARLAEKIRQLNQTDRWTFTFRVPRGHKSYITKIGIPDYNVLEWDTSSSASMEQSSVATKAAVSQFYSARSTGSSSTKTFYANDLTNVKPEEVKAALVDISQDVIPYHVYDHQNDIRIDEFAISKNGRYDQGKWFYQLTKTEKAVQQNKQIIVRDRVSRKVYSGAAARQLLGLPTYGTVRLVPSRTGQYDIFIQSTSLNRKLKMATDAVYYANA